MAGPDRMLLSILLSIFLLLSIFGDGRQGEEEMDDGEGHMLIRLDASGTRLLARVTRKSAHLLGLQARLRPLGRPAMH